VFDPYRQYATCIFCGQQDLTREHVFGKAFAEFLDVKGNWNALQYLLDDPASARPKKGSSPITSIAPKLLCNKCNSERLGQVMDQSLPLLKNLCDGASLQLSEPDKATLRRYFERFAAIVDVCTSSEQISNMSEGKAKSFQAQAQHYLPSLISFNARHAWLTGQRFEDVAIRLGHHHGVLGINPEFCVVHPVELDGSWKRIAFVVKQLAVCIDIKEPYLETPSSYIDLFLAKLFPADPAVTYDAYLALLNQTPKTQHQRLIMRFPALVDDWENRVRLRASQALPHAVG
jgi:hypothetical protein